MRWKLVYTTPEVARIVGVDAATISRRCRNGEIRARKSGTWYLIPLGEVLDLIGVPEADRTPIIEATMAAIPMERAA